LAVVAAAALAVGALLDSQVGLALVGIGAAFLLAAVVLPTVIEGRIYSPHTTA